MLMYMLICPLADIDDMHICYVLRNGDNATSDSFHFSLEDKGKSFSNDIHSQWVRLSVKASTQY